MFKKCGIDSSDRRIVNHSGRVACCTRLYNNGFDEQSAVVTGHRSNAVQIYKCPCLKQEKAVSSALVPNVESKTNIKAATAVVKWNILSTSDSHCLRIVLPVGINNVIIVNNNLAIANSCINTKHV